jgi:hypothetical protein
MAYLTAKHHHAALGLALQGLLQHRNPQLGWRLGLRPDAVQALHAVQRPLHWAPALQPAAWLAFDDRLAGSSMPPWLRSPLDGCRLPVQALRTPSHGLAHGCLRARNVSHGVLEGSLGAVLREPSRPSRLLALTAGHVLGSAEGVQQGDFVQFEGQAQMASRFGGSLLDWMPNFARLPDSRTVDAAVAAVECEALADYAAIKTEWPTGTASAYADDRLMLRAQAGVNGGNTPMQLDVEMQLGDDERMRYTLLNALCWIADEPGAHGDSGAPVWNSRDELLGIYAGAPPPGLACNAVAVPIAAILGWLGAQVVRRGEPLLRTPAPRHSRLAVRPRSADQATAPGADTLARTLWGMARSDGAPGMTAVGHVVLNRKQRQTYWGLSVEDVCRKPFQFSCWNRGQPGLAALLCVTPTDALFAQARGIALDLLTQDANPQLNVERVRTDPTGGATYFHHRALNPPPRWTQGLGVCARIGNHIFYRDPV